MHNVYIEKLYSAYYIDTEHRVIVFVLPTLNLHNYIICLHSGPFFSGAVMGRLPLGKLFKIVQFSPKSSFIMESLFPHIQNILLFFLLKTKLPTSLHLIVKKKNSEEVGEEAHVPSRHRQFGWCGRVD